MNVITLVLMIIKQAMQVTFSTINFNSFMVSKIQKNWDSINIGLLIILDLFVSVKTSQPII